MSNNYLSRRNILERIAERDIFQAYFPNKIDLRRNKYKNPFRQDTRPGSCHFNWYRGRLRFFDKATGESFDCFDFLMKSANCTFYEAMHKINLDFRLGLIHKESRLSPDSDLKIDRKFIPHNSSQADEAERPPSYSLKKRKWNEYDGMYWNNRYKIKCSTLIKFNVVPVESYKTNYRGSSWIPSYEYNYTDPCYAYKIYEDDKLYVKFYRPLAKSKEDKWKSNLKGDMIHGLNQLPKEGNVLIISSSLKDGMCLYEMGFNFCCTITEICRFPKEIWEDLTKRFKRVIYLLDNDKAGIKWMEKMNEEMGAEYIILPNLSNCKDVGEFVETVGFEETKQIINNLLIK